jgi:hypothetical protein
VTGNLDDRYLLHICSSSRIKIVLQVRTRIMRTRIIRTRIMRTRIMRTRIMRTWLSCLFFCVSISRCEEQIIYSAEFPALLLITLAAIINAYELNPRNFSTMISESLSRTMQQKYRATGDDAQYNEMSDIRFSINVVNARSLPYLRSITHCFLNYHFP